MEDYKHEMTYHLNYHHYKRAIGFIRKERELRNSR